MGTYHFSSLVSEDDFLSFSCFCSASASAMRSRRDKAGTGLLLTFLKLEAMERIHGS